MPSISLISTDFLIPLSWSSISDLILCLGFSLHVPCSRTCSQHHPGVSPASQALSPTRPSPQKGLLLLERTCYLPGLQFPSPNTTVLVSRVLDYPSQEEKLLHSVRQYLRLLSKTFLVHSRYFILVGLDVTALTLKAMSSCQAPALPSLLSKRTLWHDGSANVDTGSETNYSAGG